MRFAEFLPKACVVLGAGASCDVWNEGTSITNENLKPPLTRELFDIQARPIFSEFMRPYPGVRYLSPLLRRAIADDTMPLEEMLRHYATHEDADLREKFKHVPAYLRDLLWQCSHNYVEEPASYIELTTELLAEQPHMVLFLTLNYDDLLETALSRRSGFTFSDRSDYNFHSGRQANVVKLHGSINWFIQISPPDGRTSDWDRYVRELDVTQLPAEVIVRNNIVRTRDRVGSDGLLYPWITAPLAEKDTSDIKCLPNEIEAAKEFIRECRKFLIVGISGLDDDLMEILDEALGTRPVPPYIHFVAGNSTEAAWRRFQAGVPAFRQAVSTSIVNQNLRFQEYLSRGLLRTFASATIPVS